jgi:hypothetical protein
VSIKEADLKNHISNPTLPEEPKRKSGAGNKSTVTTPRKQPEASEKSDEPSDAAEGSSRNGEISLDKDNQLRSALDVLKDLIKSSGDSGKKEVSSAKE